MEIDVEKLSNERPNTAMRLLRARGIEAAWRSIAAATRPGRAPPHGVRLRPSATASATFPS